MNILGQQRTDEMLDVCLHVYRGRYVETLIDITMNYLHCNIYVL